MKKNKILIPIIIILVLLIGCGAAFAYIYFATDILKSNQQLFAENGKIVVENIKTLLNDEVLQEYANKKRDTPYENEGSVNVSTNSQMLNINSDIISFNGAFDTTNKNAEENVKINFSKDVSFEASYIRNDNSYALGSAEVVNKFLAVNNENLKNFAKKLGIESLNIPNSIAETSEMNFTSDEIDMLLNTYCSVIVNNLTANNFEKDTSSTVKKYILTISGEQLKTIETEIITKIKNDEILSSKFGNMYTSIQSEVDTILDEISKTDYSQEYIKITMFNVTKDSAEFVIESKDASVSLNITANSIDATLLPVSTTDEKVNSIAINISRNSTTDNDKYDVTVTTEGEQSFSATISMEYSGVLTDSANEKVVISLKSSEIEGKITYNNALNFKSSVQIEELNGDNSIILNEYPEEDLKNLMSAIGNQIQLVFTEKMTNSLSDPSSIGSIIGSMMVMPTSQNSSTNY